MYRSFFRKLAQDRLAQKWKEIPKAVKPSLQKVCYCINQFSTGGDSARWGHLPTSEDTDFDSDFRDRGCCRATPYSAQDAPATKNARVRSSVLVQPRPSPETTCSPKKEQVKAARGKGLALLGPYALWGRMALPCPRRPKSHQLKLGKNFRWQPGCIKPPHLGALRAQSADHAGLLQCLPSFFGVLQNCMN